MTVNRVTILADFNIFSNLFLTLLILWWLFNWFLWVVVNYFLLFQLLHYLLFSLPYCTHNITWNQFFICWNDCWIEVKIFWSSSWIWRRINKMRNSFYFHFTKLSMTFYFFSNINSKEIMICFCIFFNFFQIMTQKS